MPFSKSNLRIDPDHLQTPMSQTHPSLNQTHPPISPIELTPDFLQTVNFGSYLPYLIAQHRKKRDISELFKHPTTPFPSLSVKVYPRTYSNTSYRKEFTYPQLPNHPGRFLVEELTLREFTLRWVAVYDEKEPPKEFWIHLLKDGVALPPEEINSVGSLVAMIYTLKEALLYQELFDITMELHRRDETFSKYLETLSSNTH